MSVDDDEMVLFSVKSREADYLHCFGMISRKIFVVVVVVVVVVAVVRSSCSRSAINWSLLLLLVWIFLANLSSEKSVNLVCAQTKIQSKLVLPVIGEQWKIVLTSS